MKYIEELSIGDTFSYNNNIFILTSDFKKNNDRSCVCLTTGQPRWFKSEDVVEACPIYTMDKDNNIVPMKVTEKCQ